MTIWTWSIDRVLPRQSFATEGQASNLDDALTAFRQAWDSFRADPDRLDYFLLVKIKGLSSGPYPDVPGGLALL
jgi:hypothetical protein